MEEKEDKKRGEEGIYDTILANIAIVEETGELMDYIKRLDQILICEAEADGKYDSAVEAIHKVYTKKVKERKDGIRKKAENKDENFDDACEDLYRLEWLEVHAEQRKLLARSGYFDREKWDG